MTESLRHGADEPEEKVSDLPDLSEVGVDRLRELGDSDPIIAAALKRVRDDMTRPPDVEMTVWPTEEYNVAGIPDATDYTMAQLADPTQRPPGADAAIARVVRGVGQDYGLACGDVETCG